MFDKKAIILMASLAGLLVIALTTTILLDSTSEPITFENDYSETGSFETSSDEEAGFDLDIDYDIDSDIDSDFDSDFDSDDVDSDDFDVSTNTGLAVGAYSIDGDDFIEYKNIFDLKFDLSDVVKYIKNKYPEDHYRMNGIIIDENEKTSNGYNANIRVDFTGYDTNLIQGVILSYNLDETFNSWEYKCYELNGEEKIYSDLNYFEVERAQIPFIKEGTFVYEAINRDVADIGQYRKLYIYYVAPGTAMEYEVSTSCIELVNSRVTSVDTINKIGDTSLRPKEPVRYDSIENSLERVSDSWHVFKYNENGGVSEDRQYVRISDEILSPQEIADVWVNSK